MISRGRRKKTRGCGESSCVKLSENPPNASQKIHRGNNAAGIENKTILLRVC